MLYEIKIRKLPQRIRKIRCDNCGRTHYVPRYKLSGYDRVENEINVECCGWKMYGKGYDKELNLCQKYTS